MVHALEVPEEVRSSFTGELLGPGDAGYEEACRVHNGIVDKHPGLIARCRTTADVVDAVVLGRQAKEVSVRGGGHGVAGKAVTDGGLMIDLALMKSIRVDPRDRRIWAQGGVTWRELNRAAAVHGLATTGGVVMRGLPKPTSSICGTSTATSIGSAPCRIRQGPQRSRLGRPGCDRCSDPRHRRGRIPRTPSVGTARGWGSAARCCCRFGHWAG